MRVSAKFIISRHGKRELYTDNGSFPFSSMYCVCFLFFFLIIMFLKIKFILSSLLAHPNWFLRHFDVFSRRICTRYILSKKKIKFIFLRVGLASPTFVFFIILTFLNSISGNSSYVANRDIFLNNWTDLKWNWINIRIIHPSWHKIHLKF